MLNENRFLGTFRGHNTRTKRKPYKDETFGGNVETFSNSYFVFETQIMVYHVIVHLYERVFSSVVDLKNH